MLVSSTFSSIGPNSKTLNVSLNSVKWILYTCFVFICGYKSRMTHFNGMKIGAVKSNYRDVPFMKRLFVIISHFHGHSSSIFLSCVDAKHARIKRIYSNYGREKNIRDFCYLSFSSFHAIANRYSILFAAHCPVHMLATCMLTPTLTSALVPTLSQEIWHLQIFPFRFHCTAFRVNCKQVNYYYQPCTLLWKNRKYMESMRMHVCVCVCHSAFALRFNAILRFRLTWTPGILLGFRSNSVNSNVNNWLHLLSLAACRIEYTPLCMQCVHVYAVYLYQAVAAFSIFFEWPFSDDCHKRIYAIGCNRLLGTYTYNP